MLEEVVTPEVIEDELVRGFASTIEEAGETSAPEFEARVAGVAQRLGAGRFGDQGLVGDLIRKVISRVRGRKLVEDHGVHEVEVPWLSLHVPARGRARLKLSRSDETQEGMKFSLVGLGLGDGWSYKATLTRDFRERERCMAVVETFRIWVRCYAYQHAPADFEFRSDVTEHVGTTVRELDRCPVCEPLPDDDPPLVTKAGKIIDLIGDPVGQTISETVVLSGSSEFEVGLKVKMMGDLGASAGVTCKRKVASTCDVEYTLTGGYLYEPIRRLEYDDLPFWRVRGV
ncbi:MAG: hypothetical protein ACOY0T_28520 [Myxococcota bacterium]